MSHPIPGHDYTEKHKQESEKEHDSRRHKAIADVWQARRLKQQKSSGLAHSVKRLASSVSKHDKLVNSKPSFDLFKRSSKHTALKSKMGKKWWDKKVSGTRHDPDDTRGE